MRKFPLDPAAALINHGAGLALLDSNLLLLLINRLVLEYLLQMEAAAQSSSKRVFKQKLIVGANKKRRNFPCAALPYPYACWLVSMATDGGKA